MSALTQEQADRRQKTLLAAFLLSLWAPFVTGYAVILSSSITQVADFVRRTAELVALGISWQVFRYLRSRHELDRQDRMRIERIAALSVAGALAVSGLVMLGLAFNRLSDARPGGSVTLGLTIAVLGLLTNGWFWRRYTRMTRESYNAVIASQSRLYGAKSAVDLVVILALGAVAVSPGHPLTGYIDVLGSVGVAGYLLWSSLRTWKAAPR